MDVEQPTLELTTPFLAPSIVRAQGARRILIYDRHNAPAANQYSNGGHQPR